MPPKKSGESSIGGMAANNGVKRKFHETRPQAKSRSQTPNSAAALSSTGNGSSGSQEASAAISFTPMNGPKLSTGIPVRNGTHSRNGTAGDSASRDVKSEAVEDEGESAQANHHAPRKRSATELPNSGELGSGTASEGNSYEPVSKIPRRKRSSRFKEGDDMVPRESDVDVSMADATTGAESGSTVLDSKKKGKLSFKDAKKEKQTSLGFKPVTKQSTLERHFRPLSQEKVLVNDENSSKSSKTERIDNAVDAELAPNTKLKIKLKVPNMSSDSQTVPPASFYGSPTSATDLPVNRIKNSQKHIGTGELKETLVLPTNPPSSDTLSESFPSPTAMIDTAETSALMTPVDSNSSFSRGRRATRNAQPYYSGPPPFTIPTPISNTPLSHSRNVSPSSKSARKRSTSPKRGGKKSLTTTTPSSNNNNSSTTPVDSKMDPAGNNARRGGRSGRKLFDDFGELIDFEPAKQLPAYAPRAPSSCEYGMLPLGTLPPKERVDEVFNRNPPHEPEPRSDMTSAYPFSNLWGTVGNKDVTTLKGNQGRAKKMFMKAGRLDEDCEWVYPDTVGAKLVVVIDQDDMPPLSAGPLSSNRVRTKTPRLSSISAPFDTSLSPSPSFAPDQPTRSTEELMSPVSENVPETPQEATSMNIDEPEHPQPRKKSEASVFMEDTLDIQAPAVADIDVILKDQAPKPPLLAIIRQAKAAAESAGNSEILGLLTDLEAAGDTPGTRDLLNQILRGDVSRRLSPVTIPGGKRTATQRDEDEAEYERVKPYRGPRFKVLKRFIPGHIVRGRRPDNVDDEVAIYLHNARMEGRRREAELNELYLPTEYSCIRDEPDYKGKQLYPTFVDRNFEVDRKAADREHAKKFKMTLTPDRASTPPNREPEPVIPTSSSRGKRRKILRERPPEPPQDTVSEEDPENQNMDELIDQMVDDDESPCTVCGGVGAPLVICDGPGCHEEQHYDCADPPLSQEEVDSMPQWFCRSCTARKNYGRKGPEYKGIFGKLIERADKTNPRAFQLPKAIREYYSGVETGEMGEYKVAIDHYDLTKSKMKDLRAYDHMKQRNELAFEEQLLGSNGKTALCYSCKQSRMRTDRGELLACDYCTEYWHMDCLTDPLTDPPAIKAFGDKPNDQVVLAKWKCPLHVPDAAYPTRRARQPSEGRDAVWPPKHRTRKASPPPTAAETVAPLHNWQQIHRHGQDRMLPEHGPTLSFLPGVNRARAQKELNEQTFTGVEVQVIEALRNMPIAAASSFAPGVGQVPTSANFIADLILRSVPENIRAATEASIANGAFDNDKDTQVQLMTAIKQLMESSIEALRDQR